MTEAPRGRASACAVPRGPCLIAGERGHGRGCMRAGRTVGECKTRTWTWTRPSHTKPREEAPERATEMEKGEEEMVRKLVLKKATGENAGEQ